MSFHSVYWGKDEAKGDARLLDYFYPIHGYSEIPTGGKRYVIGRKGTGKTAICERLRLEASRRTDWYTSDLSLKTLPLNSLRALRNRSYREKAQYVPIWTFLLLTEFARLVVKDRSAGPTTYELSQFISLNFPSGGFAQTLMGLESQGGKVSVFRRWLGFGTGGDAVDQVRFEQLNPWLLQQLQDVSSPSTFFVLMDELDEGYSAGDSSLRLILLALLRATEDFALAFSRTPGGAQYRPLLVLRSDIFDTLEDNDLNKLDDVLIRLRWKESPTATYSLRDVVNARVRASIPALGDNDPWDFIAIDQDPNLPPKVDDLWSYIANRTFERPRDILKFLKCCGEIDMHGKLTYGVVREAENSYSEWLYNELRDELQSHLQVWAEALSCITKAGSGILTVEEFRKELSNDEAVAAWMMNNNKDPEFVIGKLFDFGVVGNLSPNQVWLFKYKDHALKFNPSWKLIVHFGFHKRLRLYRRPNWA